MNVSNSQNIAATLKALDVDAAKEATTTRLQVSMLKKMLETQKEQAAQLTQLVEGKGQIIDIRA
ncbi:MAG: putative motility protein [Armatimonadetes bacterium]|nr:putative motility protein [Armatimonadota bacterium]